MSTPAEVVSAQFDAATAYADSALAQLASFTAALSDAIYTTPTFDVTWTPIDAPTTVVMPSRPGELSSILASLVWDAGTAPTTVDPSAPDIEIDEFTDVAPTLTIPDAPTLVFGDAPSIDYGTKPTAPDVSDVTLPDAPTLTLPDSPSYLSLSTPTFAGLDLHSDMLTFLEDELPDAPLDLVAPTPYTYSPGPTYTSALLSALREVLTTRIQGGTGLNQTVETAIWDRARSREAALGQANEDEVLRTAEASGFKLPTGVVAAQLRKAQQDTIDKISAASRDIAIKQADLEQSNLDKAVQLALDCEGKLIDQSLQLERIAFESAKESASNAILIHNAAVDRLRALLTRYEAFRQAYQSIVEGERLKLEQYKADLQGEETKANINRTLVEEYRAKVQAQESLVHLFEAQLEGVKSQVAIETAKVQRFGEQIRGYVAGISGETAKIEAYKVNAEAQKTKADAFDSQVRGQLSRVDVFRSTVEAYRAKVAGQGEKARAQLGYYEAVIKNNAGAWDAYRARASAEAERFRGLTAASNSVLDSYKAEAEVALRTADQDIRRWETTWKQYEATANYTLQAAKITSDVLSANRQATLEAAKVGASVYAQVTGSALGMIHASAGVSASGNNSVSWSYSNDTSTSPDPVTAA